MTVSETTTPNTEPETVPQSCGDEPSDIGNIPAFLVRVAGDTKLQRRTTTWRTTPAMKDAAQKDQARREKIAARPVVLRAIEDGAETFGQVRKATELPDPSIQAALRFHVKAHAILKDGKRYRATARRRGTRTDGS